MDRVNPEATQADIARAVGISRPSVSRIVPRRRRHNLEIVAQLTLSDIPPIPSGCEVMITPSGVLGKMGSPSGP